jgi:phage shock protein E
MGGLLSSNSSDDEVLQALQTPNRLVIDCRSPGEFSAGDGFTGALNIPVDSVEKRLNEFGDKKRTIITYCAAGARSCRAADTLKTNGFLSVFSTTNANHLREIARRLPK